MLSEVDLKQLNDASLNIVNKYLELSLFGTKVTTPYFLNVLSHHFSEFLLKEGVDLNTVLNTYKRYKNNECPYGWYQGKGTPEELEQAVVDIAKRVRVSLENATPEGIRAFMSTYGLGIDCSGFVYNVLLYAFTSVGFDTAFNASLAWSDGTKQEAGRAGTFIFAKGASISVAAADVQPLDFILLKEDDKYSHIALLLKKGDIFVIAQSSLKTAPAGVTLNELYLKDNKPDFKVSLTIFPTWNDLYESDALVFRRLKLLT